MSPFLILFEDDDLLVSEKPTQLPSQPSVDKTRPNFYTALELQVGKKLYLHHRLDKDTSGLMIFAKSNRANRPLADLFKNRQIHKTYQAVSRHRPQLPEWSIENFLAEDKTQKIIKMRAVSSGGQKAITTFKLTESAKNMGYVFECSPLTGRTHQIRIHALLSGIPLLGDGLYGKPEDAYSRLMLHAKQLEFTHPFSGDKVSIVSPTSLLQTR